MHNWIETELPDEWGTIDLYTLPRSKGTRWAAKLYVQIPNPSDISTVGYLQFFCEGDSADEAVARLEQSVVETLAQGGELEERRHKPYGRRSYDLTAFDMKAPHTFTRRRRS